MSFAPLIGRLTIALTPIVLIAGIAGCNSDPLDRSEVSGKVTWDGKPVGKGQIRFLPANGPVWIANIKDGIYTTAGTKGVPVGKLRIEIQAFRVASGGSTQAGDPDNDGSVPVEQYLPPKYNLRSELNMVIEPGNHTVEKNFELTTR